MKKKEVSKARTFDSIKYIKKKKKEYRQKISKEV